MKSVQSVIKDLIEKRPQPSPYSAIIFGVWYDLLLVNYISGNSNYITYGLVLCFLVVFPRIKELGVASILKSLYSTATLCLLSYFLLVILERGPSLFHNTPKFLSQIQIYIFHALGFDAHLTEKNITTVFFDHEWHNIMVANEKYYPAILVSLFAWGYLC